MAGTSNIGDTGQQIYKNEELAYGIGTSPTVLTVGGVKFYPTSVPVETGGDLKEYKDNTGTTCALVVPETWQTINLTGLLIKDGAGGFANLKKGDEVSGIEVDGMKDGVTWRVQSATVNWQNEDVAQVNMTVKSYTF